MTSDALAYQGAAGQSEAWGALTPPSGDILAQIRALALGLSAASRWWHPGDVAGSLYDPVASWVDRLQGTAITQGSAGAQPYIDEDAGGRRWLYFDGGDRLRSAAFASAVAQPFAVIAAAKLAGGSGNRYIFDTTNDAVRVYFLIDGDTRSWINAGSSVASLSAVSTTAVYAGVYNGASSVNAVNGVAVASGNASTNSLQSISVGIRSSEASGGWVGTIGDALIIPGVSSLSQIAPIITLLRQYYSI